MKQAVLVSLRVFFLFLNVQASSASKYFNGSKPVTWAEAKAWCGQHKSRLAVLKSDVDNAQAGAACRFGGPHGCWIGLKDVYGYGTRASEYLWVDNSKNTQFPQGSIVWAANQPDNGASGGEGCVSVTSCFGLSHDVAAQKPAYQTSNYASSNKWFAYHAVAGTSGQNWYGQSCQATAHGIGNWWYVDLGSTHGICAVQLAAQLNYEGTIANTDIFVTNRQPDTISWTPTRSETCTHIPQTFFGPKTFKCSNKATGRYVGIKSNQNSILVACNVKVFGAAGVAKWSDTSCDALSYPICEQSTASTPTSPPPGQIEKRPRQTASILIQGDPHDCKVKSQSGSSTDLIKIEKAGTLAAIMFKSKRGGVTSHRDLSGRAFWGNAGVNEFIVAVGHRADSSSPFELIYPKTGTKNFDGLVAREDMYRMKGVTTKDHKLLFVGPTYEVSPGDELRFCGLNSFSKSAFLTGNYGGTTYANVDLFYEVETFPGIGGLAVTRGRLVGSIGLVTLLVVLCVVAPIAYVRVKRRGFAGLKDATGPVYGATTAHTQGL